MLSDDLPTTPRPLPPAKLRRPTSKPRLIPAPVTPPPPVQQHDWPSPPPYALSIDLSSQTGRLPTLLGSPIAATSQLMRFEDLALRGEDWVHERSQEELQELLQRADSIIREREQELNMTSETCKALAESNNALKSKNNAFISRLPASRPGSPQTPLTGSSPAHSRSPSSSNKLLSMSPMPSPIPALWSPKVPCPSLRRRAHARRVSATPAELAVLADQNAELLNKLADLESDAARAEQAGKRRLQGLEREIQGLRGELDATRALSARLEETLQAAPNLGGLPSGLDEQLVRMWKKLDREARVRELKAKTRPWDQDGTDASDETRDFAPGSSSSPLAPKWRPQKSRLSSETSLDSPVSPLSAYPGEKTPGSPSPSSFSTLGANSREHALVSQLLLKIRELEETNTALAVQHATTRLRLNHARSETDEARRLCEFIGDEVELEMEVVDGDADESAEATEGHDADPSALGPETPPRKTRTIRLRSLGRKTSLNFDGSVRSDTSSPSRLRRFSSMDSLAAGQAGRDRAPKQRARKTVLGLFDEGASPRSSDSPPGLERHGPAPRPPSPPSTHARDGPPMHPSSSFSSVDDSTGGAAMPSLGSELGGALGALGLRPLAPAHGRSQSIAELLRAAERDDAGDGEPRAPLPRARRVSRSALSQSGSREEEASLPIDEAIKYPTLRRATSSGPASKGAQGDGSAADSFWSLDDSASALFPPERPHSRGSSPTGPRADSPGGAQPTQRRAPPANKYAALLVELWLWLQFAVVVVVFVCAMARMGPKSLFRPPASAQKGKAR